MFIVIRTPCISHHQPEIKWIIWTLGSQCCCALWAVSSPEFVWKISHWNLSAVRLRQNILIFALFDIFEHTELLCLDNINVSNEWLWVEGGDGGDVWTLSVTTSNSSGGTLVARWKTPPRTLSWLLTSVLSQSEPRYHTAIKCWCSL